ncbi:MAG: tRNA preQ1(34) S-adenosylmethionine ribosyltransferase-isomerase QueA [Rhodospirillales bacterium]
MKVDLFDFELPAERIAQHPAEPRTAARLLRIPADGPLIDVTVADLPGLIEPGDLMVFNDTRVIPARLRGVRRRKPDDPGAKIELTLHKRVDGATWHAFARPAKKLTDADTIRFADDFACRVTDKLADGEVLVTFDCADADLDHMLDRYGEMPLPPYIRRRDDTDPAVIEDDRSSYQTAYARYPGAVAAPTAGLHFTDDLMAALDARGVRRSFVTLHVGAGTFLPVKADDTDDHRMHSEWGTISEHTAALVAETRARGNKIVAVGTTSLRLLESAARDSGEVRPFTGETDIFITPGYRFRAVDRLMTNFHLPKSTLFMLVSAFAGLEHMKAAYAHAIAQQYRFYSYGDACLIDRF